MDPSHTAFIAESLTKHFDVERVRDVIGNNPGIFESDWCEVEEKIQYLQKTMHVSAYRIAMTPNSLTRDLEFYRLRYEFLLRSGNYRHPDPTARSALPQGILLLSALPTLLADYSLLRVESCPPPDN